MGLQHERLRLNGGNSQQSFSYMTVVTVGIQSAIHVSGCGVSQQSELPGLAAREAASQSWQLPADYDASRHPMHSLQRSFGTAAFLTLTPESYSKRVLDATVHTSCLVTNLRDDKKNLELSILLVDDLTEA